MRKGRTRLRIPATWVSLLAVSLAGTPRAVPQEPERPPLVFGAAAAAVTVDVVVRDKKGNLVEDLTAADFEILEDGTPQALDSFRIVDRRPAGQDRLVERAEALPTAGPAPSAPAPAPTPEPPPDPAVIAFVFDRLSPNGRGLARQASLAYAARSHVPGDIVGVFAIDLALHTLQPFTTDLDSVRDGLERAASQANTPFAANREEARRREESVDRTDDVLGALSSGGGQSQDPGAVAGILATQQMVDVMVGRMERSFDAMERDQQGFASIHGLLAVVGGLKALPGRKTVVYFSEGLSLPANVMAQFRSVIASANRANVSVYAIDAGGLRVESGLQEAREELRRNATARLRQEESAGSGRPSREALSRGMERNESALRLDPESGLGQLAEETGGFLVRGTNDLRSGFSLIAQDMRFHYVLSYAPSDTDLDGRFRTISVRVRRPGVKVQSRKGYFAVRPEYVVPVRTFEAPALAQLDKTPPPDAFPLGVGALSFPERERPGLVPVLVSVPAGALRWDTAGEEGRAELAIVVRIRDEAGREADRLGQEYRLSAKPDKVEVARTGDILFYRETELPPGRYVAEAVGFDAVAQSASVRRAPFEVPAAEDGKLRLSSLVLVSRADALTAEERQQKSPLHFGEAMLYPHLGLPFQKSAQPALGFYFGVYGRDVAGVRAATIEVEQDGRSIAKTEAPLGAPDADGRIQHAGAIPLKPLGPGHYTLRVSVGDGSSQATRAAEFDVIE